MNRIQRAVRQIRAEHGVQRRGPTVLVPGFGVRALGEGHRYETRGGRRIYHPSAYARRGWSNIVYVPSTRRVEIGIGEVCGRL